METRISKSHHKQTPEQLDAKKVTVSCKYCGTQFRTASKKHSFCSTRCRLCWQDNHRKKSPPVISTCKHCGKQFTAAQYLGHRQLFCCKSCASRYRSKYSSGKLHTFVCRYCLQKYSTIHPDRNQYCSREHAFADFARWRKIFPGKEKPIKTPVVIRCAICGTEFTTTQPTRKICSSSLCHRAYVRRYQYDHYQPVLKREANCKMCGQNIRVSGHQRYCLSCARIKERETKRIVEDRRRARKKAAYISDVSRKEIYKRDHWICGICGDPVDAALKFPDPGSPTLDHIIPLAKGGTHEHNNVQLAHFICNSTKRDLFFTRAG